MTSPRRETLMHPGAFGSFEVLIDHPSEPVAQALIIHPHPRLGGTARHKVPHAIARALAASQITCWRPNLPHAGALEGRHDGNGGELDELCQLLKTMHQLHEDLPIVVVGFSFGAHLAAHLSCRQPQSVAIADFLLCGLPVGNVMDQRHYETPLVPEAYVVHGEADESVPLRQVLEWAAPQGNTVTVVPQADHFFTGNLSTLTRLLAERALLKVRSLPMSPPISGS